MNIKFGMPTLIEFNAIEENMMLCKKLHLDFVELNMNMLYCLPENNDIERLLQLKNQYKIDFTMHFPEEIDFGTHYEEMQEANLLLFKRYLTYAVKLGVKKINIHLLPGPRITLPERIVYAYEKYGDEYSKRVKKAFKKLVTLAKSHDIAICIENVEVPDFLKKVFTSLNEIDGLCFTYDVGHDAKSNFTIESVYKNTLIDKVKHMHLHDYDKKSDHQILFTGIMNLYDRLEFAKKNDMTVVIEVKSIKALTKSVENLMLRNLIIKK